MSLLSISYRKFRRWCKGLGHSRGFGVQSPFAYSFVTGVVGERWPYYAYGDLQNAYPQVKGRELKFCRLLLRLSNYAQAESIFLDDCLDEVYAAYLSAGCRQSDLVKGTMPPTGCGLYVLRCEEVSAAHLLEVVKGEALVLMTDIYASGHPTATWQRLLADERVSVAFDLARFGIFFLHANYHKRSYYLNF